MARQAIKSLVQDHRYDYIETGSLISIHQNVKDILIPSEERKITMFPMDYEEFLWALGDTVTVPLLKKAWESETALGDAESRRQMRSFRLYMLVGGMPQAVARYIETNNFRLVDEVKRDIINLYEEDLRKIDRTGRLSALYDAVPAQLSKNASRYQTSAVIDASDADRTLELISELEDSKMVLVAHHSDNPEIGLSAKIDLKHYKMYL